MVTPDRARGDERYTGDDLALLQTLGAARRAGLTDEMLPIGILEPYVRAVRELARTELRIFREGVVPRAGARLGELVEASTKLSERLIVLLRRKTLLPTLQQMIAEASSSNAARDATHDPRGAPSTKRPARTRAPTPAKKKRPR